MQDYSNYTDSELITLFRQGNEKAFQSLIGRYKPKLVLDANIFGAEEIDELVQEVLIAFWKKLKDTKDEIIHIRSYLFTSFKNLTYSYHRKKKSNPLKSLTKATFTEECLGNHGIEDTKLETYIEEQSFYDLIKTLTQKQKRLLTLRFVENIPYAQIAHMLDITEGAAKSNISHALTTLKKKIA